MFEKRKGQIEYTIEYVYRNCRGSFVLCSKSFDSEKEADDFIKKVEKIRENLFQIYKRTNIIYYYN